MELITDLKAIRKEIGLRLEESSLYPKLNLDAYKDVTPILVKKGPKEYFLLVKEVETGNFTAGGSAEPVIRKRKIRTIFYSSYFTWDKLARKRPEFPPDEAAALEKAFRTKRFAIHPDMALDRFRRLTQKFDLNFLTSPASAGKAFAYPVPLKGVEAAFLKKRKAVNRWASRAVDRELKIAPRDKRTIGKFLARPPFRAFRVLDRLMAGEGLSSLLASSPINLQEMTGIPFDRIKGGLLGLYAGKKVYLISPRPLPGLKGGRISRE